MESTVSYVAKPTMTVHLNVFCFDIINQSLSLPDALQSAGVADPTQMTREVALKALEKVAKSCERVVFWTKPIVILTLGVVAVCVGNVLFAMEAVALVVVGAALIIFGWVAIGFAIRMELDRQFALIPMAFAAVAGEARALLSRVKELPAGSEVKVSESVRLPFGIYS